MSAACVHWWTQGVDALRASSVNIRRMKSFSRSRYARWTARRGPFSLLIAVTASAALAGPVEQAQETVKETNRADAISQDRIDELSEETRRMLQAYRQAIRKKQQLAVYNQELEKIVAEQRSRKQALQARIEQVRELREKAEPLLLRMVDTLERFVQADLPFQQSERKQRIKSLREAIADPSVGIAESFRRVLDAYQAEAEYGRSIGASRGELTFSGETRLVEFLRVGRTMLFYITPDDRNVGYWDRKADTWKPLSTEYRTAIREGIEVARDQAAPQLIEIAVPAPTPASGLEEGAGTAKPSDAAEKDSP